MHNYTTRSIYHIDFKKFRALGAEFWRGQKLTARPLDRPTDRLPARHAHDNTPCSQRLRGKN